MTGDDGASSLDVPTGEGAPAWGAVVGVLGGLTAYGLARRWLVPDDWSFAANVAMVVALVGVARVLGLRAAELGLTPGTWRRGLRWGAAAAAVVVAVVGVGLAVPGADDPFTDDRLEVGAATMAWIVLVRIPLGTVLLEELAFRGVLAGLLRRRTSAAATIVATSVAFGLWHVPPLLGHTGADATDVGTVVATVAGTTVVGAGFGWLRERADSLLAPVLAHLATNSLAFALAWAVR